MATVPEAMYEAFQAEADRAGLDPVAGSAWNRPVLNRLRDYVAIVLRPLNMQIRAVSLAAIAPTRITIKISTAQHLALVLAPHEILAAEIYLRRVAQQKHLPFPAVIRSDLSYNTVPVGYMLSPFLGGQSLAVVTDDTLQRVGARQIGRTVRVLHTTPAAGIGTPQPDGSWKQRDWRTAVLMWLTASGAADGLADTIGPHIAKRFWERWSALIPDELTQAVVLHGDIDPRHAAVSVSSHIQLEGVEGAGMLVGGDAMYDVAATMRGRFHPEFRTGFMEGYVAAGPLTSAETQRVKHYLLGYRVVDAINTPGLDRDAFATSIEYALKTMG